MPVPNQGDAHSAQTGVPAASRAARHTIHDHSSASIDTKIDQIRTSLRKGGTFDARVPGEAGTPTVELLVAYIHNNPPSESIGRALEAVKKNGMLYMGTQPGDPDRHIIAIHTAHDDHGRELIYPAAVALMINSDVLPVMKKHRVPRENIMFLLLKNAEYKQALALTTNPEQRQKFLGQINRETEAFKTYTDMLTFAVQLRASDIHFEPYKNGNYRARFRVDGALQDWGMVIDGEHAKRVVSLIKNESKLKIDENRRAQDGGITFGPRVLSVNPALEEYSLRVSIMPTNIGEKVNIRLINLSSAGSRFDLKKLGYPDDIYRHIIKQLSSPQGLILVTGPTGSGKTTTLYSCLEHLNTPDVNIVTIEDPVELNLDGINQGQVNDEIGNTFEEASRRYMRQDPDIIFVGEIRDKETARTALGAANTGHLVLSTVHTNDSVAAVTRLLDLGVLKSQVADSLRAVISQRLVRNLCPECSEDYDAKDELNEFFGEEVLQEPVPMKRRGSDEACSGCGHCEGSGFKGRTVVAELWIPGRKEKALINAGVFAHEELFAAAEAGGMKPLVMTAIDVAIAKRTSLRELAENVFNPVEIHEQREKIAARIREANRAKVL